MELRRIEAFTPDTGWGGMFEASLYFDDADARRAVYRCSAMPVPSWAIEHDYTRNGRHYFTPEGWMRWGEVAYNELKAALGDRVRLCTAPSGMEIARDDYQAYVIHDRSTRDR